MAFRLGFAFLMITLLDASVAHSSDHATGYYGVATSTDGHGLVADALDLDEELMLESDAAHRQLFGGGGYISYGALNKNRVPCNRRGRSYYNCRGHEQASPYSRGCTRATRCARQNH